MKYAGYVLLLIAVYYGIKKLQGGFAKSVGAGAAAVTDGKTLAELFNGVVNLNGAFGGGYEGPVTIVSDPLPWSI
jgi:hypothetical protein